MGLNAALVDRARRIAPSPSAVKVEGTTQFTDIPGPWFRARLTPVSGAQTEASLRVRAGLADDGGSRSKSTERLTLMFGIKDTEGGSLVDETGRCVVNAPDRVEVASPQLGTFLYEGTEMPAVIRKKKKVIGYEVGLSRVHEFEFEERLA